MAQPVDVGMADSVHQWAGQRKLFFPSTPSDMLSATVVNVFQQVFA